MNKAGLGMLIFSILTSSTLLGQVHLSRDQAMDAALNNNRDIKIALLDEVNAEAKYRQSDAVFLPQVTLSYTGMRTTNPLNAFGFKLQQAVITQNDFNPELLNDPSATNNFMTKAELRQPLINFDMLASRKAAMEQTHLYEYKSQRTRQFIALEIEKAYGQLQLAHQAKAVMTETLETMNAVYTMTRNRFEKGYLQKSDLLQVDVQVKTIESKLAEAKSNVQNASDYLSVLMGTEPGSTYEVDSIAIAPADVISSSSLPDDRADFRAMESAVRAQDRMLSSGNRSYLPRLNAFGEYMMNDNDAFGFGANAYLIGAELSWTVFNGTATRHKISAQRAERDKTSQQFASQKEQARMELNKTLRQLNDSRFAIQQYESAVAQAEEALRIVTNRFEQGLVATYDVLQAQSLLSQQKLAWGQSIFQFNTTAAYHQFLTATSAQ